MNTKNYKNKMNRLYSMRQILPLFTRTSSNTSSHTFPRTFLARNITMSPSTRVKVFETFTTTDLKKIGYSASEANWITSMRDAYKNGVNLNEQVEKCGHSGGTYAYTKTITTNIKNNGFQNWKKNFLHLGYSDAFKLFYLPGFASVFNIVSSYNFEDSVDKIALTNFRNKYNINLNDQEKSKLIQCLITSSNLRYHQ